MDSRSVNEVVPGLPDEIIIYENGDIFNVTKGKYLNGKVVYLSNYKMAVRCRLLYLAFIGSINDGGRVYLKKGKPIHYSNLIVKPPQGWEKVVIDGYNSGLSQGEIGKILGVCGVTVMRYGRRLGLDWRNRYTYTIRYRKFNSKVVIKSFHSYEDLSKFLGYNSKASGYYAVINGSTLRNRVLKRLGAKEGEVYAEMINYEMVG